LYFSPLYSYSLPSWETHLSLLPVYAFDALLVQVGEFYEAIGFDACILVEHAGLNPFGGLRSDSIPKAGCPIVVCFYKKKLCYILSICLENHLTELLRNH
jgi:hypothetical protein